MVSAIRYDRAVSFGIDLELCYADMINEDQNISGNEEQAWANPQNPEKPSDQRDQEQVIRQYEEAKRRKNNLTEKDHIDKPKKLED